MLTRFRWPPLRPRPIVPILVDATSVRWSSSRIDATRLSVSSAARPWIRAVYVSAWRGVKHVITTSSWGTKFEMWRICDGATASPLTQISPAISPRTVHRPLNALRSVVLPAPDSPMSATGSDAWISRCKGRTSALAPARVLAVTLSAFTSRRTSRWAVGCSVDRRSVWCGRFPISAGFSRAAAVGAAPPRPYAFTMF